MAQTRLTPQWLQSIVFRPLPEKGQGLDEEQVRAVFTLVHQEITQLIKEKNDLELEIGRLRAREANRLQDAHVQAVHLLSRAQQTAERRLAEAQDFSRQVTQDTLRQHEEIAARPNPHTLGTAEELRTAEDELARIQTFSEVCRNRLRFYLKTLAQTVEEWENAERPDRPT